MICEPGILSQRWPPSSQIPLDQTSPTLLLFLHPRCPCSRSSLAELERLLAFASKREGIFVEWEKLRLVLAVLVPSAIYVATISWIGIYVSSALFIAFFMRWLGKYAWWKVAVVSVGVMVAFFLIFESWFKVPLPKGPLENLLGIA